MKNLNFSVSKLLILELIIISFILFGCKNLSETNPDLDAGASGSESQGHKVTIHWNYPTEKESSLQTIYVDKNNEVKLPYITDMDNYKFIGYIKTKPIAENIDTTEFTSDYSNGENISLTEDLELYTIWEDKNITITFHKKPFDSNLLDYKQEHIKVEDRFAEFTFPLIDKEDKENKLICNTWAKHNGEYAGDSEQSDVDLWSLEVDDYITKKYDEKHNAIVKTYNFYELWYEIKYAKKYTFNKNGCETSNKLKDCKTVTVYKYSKSEQEPDPYSLFSREGYTLLNFYEDATSTSSSKTKYFEKNKTYYAIWSKENAFITTYIYDDNSSYWIRVETEEPNRLADESIFSKRDGYLLGGWKYKHEINLSTASYLPGEKFDYWDDPLNIWYAVWQEEIDLKTWNISFYCDEDKTEEKIYEARNYPISYYISVDLNLENFAMVLPDCEFTKEGYTFVGWKNGNSSSIEQSGKRVKDFYYKNKSESQYFVAQWEKN